MNPNAYLPVTEDVVRKLGEIVGERFVITAEEKMEAYAHDETPGKEFVVLPEAVIKPRTAEEISKIVKLANIKRIPITPRGAGSGLSAGAVPMHRGIILSLERMNNILEIDKENMMAVVEPGVVTNDINNRIQDMGLFYAGYPMSEATCFIGGNVAENAGGGKAIKYGVTERYVLGLEVVTPTGEIVELGGKRVKDVTGYNLVKLMVGSEGTLGIITKIILKLLPLPVEVVDLLALFPDAETAMAVVPIIMHESGITPAAVEFMNSLAVHISCEYLNEHLPYKEAGAMLLIEVDGNNEEAVCRDYETIGELCLKNGAQEVYVADNYTTRDRLWNVRKNIAEALNATETEQSSEDIVVPAANILKIIPELEKMAKKYSIIIPCYGHAADGNLHPRLVNRGGEKDEPWQERLLKIRTELYTLTKKLGGTISGEHGIGSKRKNFMYLVASDAELEMIRRIKRALDPNNIMNPGKIVDI